MAEVLVGAVVWNSLSEGIVSAALAIALYVAVCWFLSLGGWRSLQTEFRTTRRPDGQQWRLVDGRIGHTFCQFLRVVNADEGLYLGCQFPLLFHRPVLIPWTAVQREREIASLHNSSDIRMLVETLRGPVRLTFSGNVAEAIRARLGSTM